MNVKDFSKTIVLAEAVEFVLQPETRMDTGSGPLHTSVYPYSLPNQLSRNKTVLDDVALSIAIALFRVVLADCCTSILARRSRSLEDELVKLTVTAFTRTVCQ
jgi:hypothetical protein